MKMLKLKRQLAAASPTDGDTAEHISEHIKENIRPYVTEDQGQTHGMLIYLARRIVEPDLKHDEIPQLLEIFSNVEAIRRRVVNQARLALRRQRELLESQKRAVNLFKKREINKLKTMADEEIDGSIRLVLRVDIILELCRLHICYLWTSPKFYLILKFMKRYFPANYVEDGDPFADEHWDDWMLQDLSLEEREEVFAFGENVKRFIADAHAWDVERKAYLSKFGHSEEEIFGESEFMSYKRDFNAKFRDPVAENKIMEASKTYLHEVESTANYFESLFPSEKQRAEKLIEVYLAREKEGIKSEPS